MLSSALSRIFLLAFILTIIGSIGNIIPQITGKPIKFTSKNSSTTFGEPGLVFNTHISNRQNEKYAPDTSVDYSYTTKKGQKVNNRIPLNENDFHNYKEELSKLVAERKINGEEIKLDTQITFIGEIKWGDNVESGVITSGVDSISENVFVYNKSYRNEKNKKIKEESDTFSTRLDAERLLFIGEYNTPYKISEEIFGEQQLRILPATKWQQFFFIILKLIGIISAALIFFSLSRLFKNFFNQIYFTSKNVLLLKKLGWYILVPQITLVIFYWTFLSHIHPVKIFYSSSAMDKVKLLTQYDFKSGIDWLLIFIALGIIILSHIFKDGLKMKQEQELTV